MQVSIIHNHYETEESLRTALTGKPGRWAYARDTKRVIINDDGSLIPMYTFEGMGGQYYGNETLYYIGDIVEFGGRIWVALQDDILNVTPGDDGEKWSPETMLGLISQLLKAKLT